MEIRVLRYFLTVVREESITRAAEVLHITQPTLSRQLRELEEEVGATLFYRGARRITLTNEGILLRRRAEEILQLVDKTRRDIAESDSRIEGTVTIGCGELSAVSVLPDIIKEFRKKYPLVTFDLFTAAADMVKEQMDRGLIDIGLLVEPVEIERYDFMRLSLKERWVVIMRPDDPLTEKEEIRASDLVGKPLILPQRNSVKAELKNWFGSVYDDLNVVFTSNLGTNSGIMVESSLACAVLVEGALPFWDRKKLSFRPLSPPLYSTSVIAWKRGQPTSPAVGRFIDYIQCFLSMGSC